MEGKFFNLEVIIIFIFVGGVFATLILLLHNEIDP